MANQNNKRTGETMSKRFLIGAALALVSGGSLLAQPTDQSFESIELSDGLYMFEGQLFEGREGFAGGNFALLTGSDGVILIDDAIEPMAGKVIEAVEAHTKQAVDFVINTHVHGDHIGSNAALRATGATIITHDNIRHRMLADGAVKDSLPVITFSNNVTFHLNGHTAYVFHIPNAHTDGDAVIHFPEVNVIAAGDILFNGVFPYIDLDKGGNVDGFIAALAQLLSMSDENTKIISGHGPLASRSDLKAAHDMLVDSLARVKKLLDAGMSEDEILAENPLASYADSWDWFFISAEIMTKTLYRSLTESN
jgi:glyoxylase-like metal-dependent hydrolase (beta-lactamase superfamily II)